MTIVNKQYKLIKKIGEGSFGSVYKAIHIETKKYVAIKAESIKKTKRLHHEINIYKKFIVNKYIPQIFWYGTEENYNFLVMEHMGNSLENIFSNHNQNFSMKTIIMLTIDLLKILQDIHINNILHRDLKPDNIVIGYKNNNKNIYLIDFGLSKSFINNNDGKHIDIIKNKSLVGSMRYASIRNHKGIEQSRRDELESLSYIILYFFTKSNLPWNGIQEENKQEKSKQICKIKNNIDLKELYTDIPEEFKTLLIYSKKLKFDEKPNYEYLIKLFQKLLIISGYTYDKNYDWVLK
jgi:serine/threonine protein kinase